MARMGISDELANSIREFYLSRPMSLSDVCEKFGVSHPTACKVLKGVPKYPKSRVFNPNMEEDYFKDIDTEKKAYFIGLMIADGNVFDNPNTKEANRQASISIMLKEEDEYILEEFKRELKVETSLVHDGRGCSSVAARSNTMAKDLEKYGIVPRKTLTTHLPIVREDMMPHVVRGIFDGDGSIRVATLKSGRFLHSANFCGTHKLMQDLSSHLAQAARLSWEPKVYDYKNKPLSSIDVARKADMERLYHYMYDNATIFLKRKKERFDSFMQHYNYSTQANTEVMLEIAEGPSTP